MRAVGVLLALVATLAAAAVLLTGPPPHAPVATVSVADTLGAADAAFARARGPRAFAFPADHGPHEAYRTEWWYYTGNLTTADGRRFGYQLTFFRTALVPDGTPRASAWATRDVYMAHFAVTDVAGGRFRPHVRFARGAAGLAGASAQPFRVWTDDWAVDGAGPRALPMRLHASADDVAIDLVLDGGKPPVLEGDHGWSPKGPEPGNASYYYSLTRMPTRGRVRVGAQDFDVTGLTWMDREWSTSALGDATGWDWFALHLADGRDLMFYRLRRADGSASPFSAGTLVAPDGTDRALATADVRIDALATWTTPDGVRYPSRWRVRVPSADLDLEITPRVADQEYREPVRYWEGAVKVGGASGADGSGYVELVGYGSAPGGRRG